MFFANLQFPCQPFPRGQCEIRKAPEFLHDEWVATFTSISNRCGRPLASAPNRLITLSADMIPSHVRLCRLLIHIIGRIPACSVDETEWVAPSFRPRALQSCLVSFPAVSETMAASRRLHSTSRFTYWEAGKEQADVA
jgi:hypothetical protein